MRCVLAFSTIFMLGFAHYVFAYSATESVRAKADKLALSLAREEGHWNPEGASQRGLEEFSAKLTPLSETYFEQFEGFYRHKAAELDRLASNTRGKKLRFEIELLRDYCKRKADSLALKRKYNLLISISSNVDGTDGPYQLFLGGWTGTEGLFTHLQSLIDKGTKNDVLQYFKNYVRGDAFGPAPFLKRVQTVVETQLQKGDVKSFPHKKMLEDYLSGSSSYIAAIEEILKTTGKEGWQEDFALLKTQAERFDLFVQTQILPNAKIEMGLPSELFMQKWVEEGIDEKPESLRQKAQRFFQQLLPQYQELARTIARKRNLRGESVLEVTEALRQESVKTPADLLALANRAQKYIETVVKKNDLFTLPKYRPTIRIGSEAENNSMSYPHCDIAPFFGNSGARPAYVLPVNLDGTPMDPDSGYWAGMVTLTAHESRPGHEYQYGTLLDRKVPKTRTAFADNDANGEGWAVYVEDLLMNYYGDDEARFGAMGSVLLRVARAFLDTGVQLGLEDQDSVYRVITEELGLSQEWAGSEFDRYVWSDAGQASSYFYGMIAIQEAKREIKGLLGKRFRERKFHDAMIDIGPINVSRLKDELKKRLVR